MVFKIKTKTNDNENNKEKNIYVVAVDSRGHSPSDLECYKEQLCSLSFFQEHIRENPVHICVKSEVAMLCGLDLKLFFHEHPAHHIRYSDEYKGLSPLGQINGIATLLTFNPDTGYYNHIVRGKAFILLNDGASPLSKRQVWGMQEFIREAKEAYVSTDDSNGTTRYYSHEAKMKLLTSAYEYSQGTWVPHSIYETRHIAQNHCYQRSESGMSDQATCHHGFIHAHHDGHHKCCHGQELLSDDATDQIKNSHHVISVSKDHHHPKVVHNDHACHGIHDRENDKAKHNHGNVDYKFYNKICH
jgi:hypothetical protein